MKLRNTSTIISYNYLQNSLIKIYERNNTIQSDEKGTIFALVIKFFNYVQ